MLANPADPEPRVQAAELLMRHREPARAAELFREARRLAPDDRSRELYTTQRLIDLYLGSLADSGRALVELHRLKERSAGTREADAARGLIASLKLEAEEHPTKRSGDASSISSTFLPHWPRVIVAHGGLSAFTRR